MPLISVEELARRLDEPDLVVVDCRWALNNPDHGLEAYQSGHIPGAVFADLETDLSGAAGPGRHPLPDPEAFDTTLGGWGITPETAVVVYDDAGGSIAARLWWMLTDQGHANARVLDGGIQRWVSTGHELSGETPEPHPDQPAGIATRPWTGVVSITEVANRKKTTVVVDARSPERFRGESEPVDARPGHIPGAINVPTAGNLVNGRFLAPHRLRRRYESAHIADAESAIIHCGSGVTACHDILAMELAGLPRPLLYVGSWSEWAATDRPAEVGERAR